LPSCPTWMLRIQAVTALTKAHPALFLAISAPHFT